MKDSLASRALTVAIDAAMPLAIVDATLTVIDAPPLRALAPWTALTFASAGMIAACALPLSAAACALPSPPRAIERWVAVLFTALAVAASLTLRAPFAVLALVVLARRFAAPPRRAGWGRLCGAGFCAVMSLAAIFASHATRAALVEHSRVASVVLAPIAARAPWPASSATPPQDQPVAAAIDAGPPLTLVFALDALAPRSAITLGSVQLVARNSAVLIDARRADQGRGALDRWSLEGQGAARCDIDRAEALSAFERCVSAALAREGRLRLAVRVGTDQPALADRAMRSTLRAAHARTPLSSALVALTAQGSLSSRWSDVDNDDALLLVSAPGVRPGPARGAVRTDELPRAIERFAREGARSTDPLWTLAARSAPWFDRVVRIDAIRGGVRTSALHSARASLTVAPTRWGVLLIDHDLDRSASVNRADALPSLTAAWLAQLRP